MSEQIKRYNYVCAIDDYEEAGDGEMVTYADHAARVFDLEHRLANCDADLFAMQEAKQAAERRVAEVKALLLDCYSVRQQWPHSAETDAIWIRVAELVKEQPA